MTVIHREVVQAPARAWRTYPKYRDSGVEWLGGIPSHWQVVQLRHKLKEGTEGMKIGPFGSQLKLEHLKDDGGFKVYGQENVIKRDFKVGNRYIDGAKHKDLQAYEVKSGDLLISMMGTTGRCSLVPYGIQHGVIDSHLLRLRLQQEQLDPEYAVILLDESYYVREQLRAAGRGAIMHGLNSSLLKALSLAIPPLCEQEFITAFINRETQKIDDLIDKRERLIELLEEKRTALISQAVTKGLNPEVPRKDSGVEWVGKVPEHWVAAPVYSRYEIQLGKMLDQAKFRGAAMAPYLRNTNVTWDYVNVDDVSEMEFSPEEKRKYSLKPGDLLVCEGGEVGRTAVWRADLPECYFQKAVHRLRPIRKGEKPRFLYYIMYAAARSGVFVAEGNKSTIVHLTAEKLRKHRFPFPPSGEQQVIVEYLDQETAKIDALIRKVQEHIEKLREYRTALISAAVTGKIDVRGELDS